MKSEGKGLKSFFEGGETNVFLFWVKYRLEVVREICGISAKNLQPVL